MMMKRGLTPVASLIWVFFLCTTTAVGGTISFLYQRAEFALVSIFLVVLVMMMAGIFGVAEFRLLFKKGKSTLDRISRRDVDGQGRVYQSAVQLQGNENWEQTWESLCEFADSHELTRITFDLNLPWLHESFYATRRRDDLGNGDSEWYAEIPLASSGKVLGRIEFFGDRKSKISHHEAITNLLKLTSDIERAIADRETPIREEVAENNSIESKNGAVEEAASDAVVGSSSDSQSS